MEREPEYWTVASRARTGDRYFHRVPDLILTMGQAVDLAYHLDKHHERQWRAIMIGLPTWRIRRPNRTTAKIKVMDNGSLPFEVREDDIQLKPVVNEHMLNVFLNGEHIGEADFSFTPSFNPKTGRQRKRWCAIGMWANHAVTRPLGAYETKDEAVAAVVECYRNKDKEESELLK